MNIHFIPSVATAIFSCGLATLICRIIEHNRKKRYKIKIKENKSNSKIAYFKKHPNNSPKQIYDVLNTLELSNLIWVKVGKVSNMYIYPLAAGKQHVTDECYITSWNINMFKEGQLIKGDRLFLVYEIGTNYVITTRMAPALRKLELSIVGQHIILKSEGKTTLHINFDHRNIVYCKFWCCEKLQTYPKIICTDCGDAAAQWLSRFIYGRNYGLRLGYVLYNNSVMKTFWPHLLSDFTLDTKSWPDRHNMNPFHYLLYSILISQTPYEDMIETLDKSMSSMISCPSMVISASNHYMGKIWKWIKIGEVVIKNIEPLSIWPRNKELHKHIKLFGLGFNCELYIPGYVKLNDNVYVHFL
ncbi:mitochondrial amidoxime-reducing component 1-like [Harpegnathos saltator]|uniref:mitochondrial amidoxime-reducing component 1-like n=1 Tax=Harpegnathos saltator TaxID=610380 RepID=UPI00058C32EB|nr:mitochondrial amidoxime-reducing component 1-like [Harpegnathos saltator]